MKENVLVVAAHPDDEVLGCGASLARHAKNGDTVRILILGEGATSRTRTRARAAHAASLAALKKAARKAAAILGADSVDFGDLPDNRFDSMDLLDIVKVVEAAREKYSPSIVYTHHAGDVNVDHRLTHDAVVTACRPVPGHSVRTLLFFEVPSSTEWQTPAFGRPFVPCWFNDVSETSILKLEALKAYGAEMHPWPHARSLRAVEHHLGWRGASIGVSAAEAFVLGRRIEVGR